MALTITQRHHQPSRRPPSFPRKRESSARKTRPADEASETWLYQQPNAITSHRTAHRQSRESGNPAPAGHAPPCPERRRSAISETPQERHASGSQPPLGRRKGRKDGIANSVLPYAKPTASNCHAEESVSHAPQTQRPADEAPKTQRFHNPTPSPATAPPTVLPAKAGIQHPQDAPRHRRNAT